MPLTKIRYDMLAPEVTESITASIASAGVGSPFVFSPTQDNTVETLTGYKVTTDGVTKTENVRRTEFIANKLVITLATFTPTITPSTQTLNWDVPASTFTLNVNNPVEDYPDQWISDVASMSTAAGSVSALETFDTDTTFPRTAANDYLATWTVKAGGVGYIRPTNVSGGNTGGSASGTLTLKSDTTDGDPTPWGTTYAWVANWNPITADISLATLTGKTFLQKYTSAAYTVSTAGLSPGSTAVVHTVTGTNGNVSNALGSGTLTIGTDIHKDNKTTTTTKVALSSVFTRTEAVMGTGNGYTRTLTDESADVAASASFTYPSIRLMTSTTGEPTLAAIIDDSTATGFLSTVQVLGDQTKNYPLTAIVNSTGSGQKFWFGVKSSAAQPTSIKSGDNANQYAVAPQGLTTMSLSLEPNADFGNDYEPVAYTFYGFNIEANATTYVVIS